MAQKYSTPLVTLNAADCPFPIGSVNPRTSPCASNDFADIIRVVLKKKSTPNPFTTFLQFETEATWDALLLTPLPFTANSVIYTPDFGDRMQVTPNAPDESVNGWNVKTYSSWKGSDITIPFWNLQANIDAEMYKSIKENPNNLEALFVTRQNQILYLNDPNSLTPTAPSWFNVTSALFMEGETASGQAQYVNNLMLTLDAGQTSFRNLYTIDFDLLNKS
jgi:hypothetical protein